MNPALMELYLSRMNQGQQAPQDPWQAFNERLTPEPPPPPQSKWQSMHEHLKRNPVPGTNGMMDAPEMAAPRPAYLDTNIEPIDTGYGYADEEPGNAEALQNFKNSGSDGGPNIPISDGPSSSIEKGVQSAVQARKASYGLDEEQKRQALGFAIMKLGQGFGQGQSDSVLGNINQAMPAATEAYMTERDKMQKANREIAKDIKEDEHFKLNYDLKMLEHQRKLSQNAFGNMTQYQQQNIRNQLIERRFKMEERAGKELDNWSKNQLPNIKRGDKQAALEKKEAEIKRKYAPHIQSIENEAKVIGLDLPQAMAEFESGGESTSNANGIDISKIPRKADGTFDLSGLSKEQKAQLAGE